MQVPPYRSMKMGVNVDFTMPLRYHPDHDHDYAMLADCSTGVELQLQFRRLREEEIRLGTQDQQMVCFHVRAVKVSDDANKKKRGMSELQETDPLPDLSFQPMDEVRLLPVDVGLDLGVFVFHVYSFIPAGPQSSGPTRHGILWCV